MRPAVSRPASATLFVALAFLSCLVGCRPSRAVPNLLNVAGFSPKRAEVGDRLEVIGSGFPEGKRATLTFRGSFHRPGLGEDGPREVVVAATSTSQNRISLTLTEELERELCGRDDAATHTTFRGEVVAAFAARSAGAPPVTGVVPDVVIDLPGPTVSRAVHRARAGEGERALAFVGIKAHEETLPDGVLIASVDADGRAARGGIQEGDVIVEVDGVLVRTPPDIVPSGKDRFAEFVVARGEGGEPLRRRVDVQGFRERPPEDLVHGAVIVGLAVAIMFLFMGPIATALTWTQRRVVTRLKSSVSGRRHGLRGFTAWMVQGLKSVLSEDVVFGGGGIVGRLFPYLAFLAASVGFTVLPFGLHLVAPDLDLALLVFVVSTVLLASSLMLGGWRADGRWSLLSALGTALLTLGSGLPSLAAVVSVVIVSGTLRLDDIVALQAGAPWGWNVFRSPALFVLFFLFFTSLVGQTSRSALVLPEADDVGVRLRSRHVKTRYVMFVAEWGNVFVMSGIAAALFFGGWQLPGVPQLEQRIDVHWQVVGAVVFLAKCWIIILSVLWIRWALPSLSVDQLAGPCWRWFVPLSLVAAAGSFAYNAGLENPALRGAQPVLSYVLFGVAVFAAAYFVKRVLSDLRSNQSQMHLNPWL